MGCRKNSFFRAYLSQTVIRIPISISKDKLRSVGEWVIQSEKIYKFLQCYV